MEGVVPFPPEFAAAYRAKGLWDDRPLRAVFKDWCDRFSTRVAVCDANRQVTFAELEQRSTNLALNLLDLGLRPQDRLVVQLPNVIEFAYLHFALQKIGAIPVMALPPHRFREVSFFVETSSAVGTVTPDHHKDFSFIDMTERIRQSAPHLKHRIVLGTASGGAVSLTELIERPASRSVDDLASIEIDPDLPALFLLSGGTTGIPKLIASAKTFGNASVIDEEWLCRRRRQATLADVGT